MTATSKDETGDGAPVTRAAFLPASDARIVRTWDTLGMRGADSDDVELEGLFVPERRAFRIGIDRAPGPRYDGSLYGPARHDPRCLMPAVAPGIAREELAELVALAQDKTPFASSTSLRERAVAQSGLGRARVPSVRRGPTFMTGSATAGTAPSPAPSSRRDEKAEVLVAAVQAIEVSTRGVEAAFSAEGRRPSGEAVGSSSTSATSR